jgi:hypothetical protein
MEQVTTFVWNTIARSPGLGKISRFGSRQLWPRHRPNLTGPSDRYSRSRPSSLHFLLPTFAVNSQNDHESLQSDTRQPYYDVIIPDDCAISFGRLRLLVRSYSAGDRFLSVGVGSLAGRTSCGHGCWPLVRRPCGLGNSTWCLRSNRRTNRVLVVRCPVEICSTAGSSLMRITVFELYLTFR